LSAAGTGEEKAQLMFNMYDLDNSGSLSKDEFKTMLRSAYLRSLEIYLWQFRQKISHALSLLIVYFATEAGHNTIQIRNKNYCQRCKNVDKRNFKNVNNVKTSGNK